MGHVDQTSPPVRDSRNRRFRIAVVLVSVVVGGRRLRCARDAGLVRENHEGRGGAHSARAGPPRSGGRRPGCALGRGGRRPKLRRLDLSTGAWAPPVNLGGEISQLTRVGDRLIASVQHVSGVGQLASLDWRTGDVSTWHWFNPAVDQVVVRGSELWALEPRPGRLLRLDSKTLEPVSAIPLSSGRALGLAAGAGYVWVTASDDGEVLRIDPKTHAVERVHVGGFPIGIVCHRRKRLGRRPRRRRGRPP